MLNTRNSYWGMSGRDWEGHIPAADSWEFKTMSGKMSREYTLGRLLIDNWNKSSEVDAIMAEHTRNKEVLEPEDIIKEFPNTAKIIKKPTTRAEAIYWSREKLRKDMLARAMSGQYIGSFPQGMVALGAGIAEEFNLVGNPLNFAVNMGIGFMSWGITGLIPAARSSMLLANFVRDSSRYRTSAAAVLAMDGAIGGAISGLTSYPLASRLEREYGLGNFTSEVIFGGALGGGLGLAFPRLATAQAPLLDADNAAQYVATLYHLKRQMVTRDFRKLLMSESGRVDLPALVSAFQGRQKQPTKIFLSKFGTDYKAKVKEADVVYENVSGLLDRERAMDLPEYASRLKTGKLKAGSKFTELRIGQYGILSWARHSFVKGQARIAKRFYRADFDTPVIPPAKERLEKGNIIMPETYILYSKGDASAGTILRTKHFGANSAELLAQQALLGLTPQKTPEFLSVGKVKFRDKGAFLIDLDGPNLRQNLESTIGGLFISERMAFTPQIMKQLENSKRWTDLPVSTQNIVARALKKSPQLDGIAYALPTKKGDTPQYIVELGRRGVNKIENFSGNYKEFDLKDKKPNLDVLDDLISGKHEESVPQEVRDLMDDYYKALSVEGTNYFDAFVRRRQPFSEDIFQDGTANAPVKFKRKNQVIEFMDKDYFLDSVNATAEAGQRFTGAPFEGAQIMQEVLTAIRKEGAKAEGATPRVPRIPRYRSLRGAINNLPENELLPFKKGLEKRGFEFPEVIPYNARGDMPFFTKDGIIHARKEPGNMLQRVFHRERGKDSLDLNPSIKIQLPQRTLDLTIHPSVMTPEELALSRGLIEDGVVPSVGDINRRTTFGKRAEGFLKLRTGELRAMGIGGVKLSTRYTSPVGGNGVTKSLTDIDKYVDSLGVKKKVETEGSGEALKVDERLAHIKKYFAQFQGNDRMNFYQGLVREIKEMTPATTTKDYLEELWGEHRRLLQRREQMTAGSAGYLEISGQIRQLEASIIKMHSLVKSAREVNLRDPDTRMGKWWKKLNTATGTHPEVTGILASGVDQPYRALGGDNIEVTRNALMQKYQTALMRGFEELGGSDMVWYVQGGVFDEDLLRIRHYREKKRLESQGLSGKLQEQTEELQVSQMAWKIYNHIERVMKSLDKELQDAGIYREPRLDYIGTRFYDLRQINKTPLDEFVEDVVEATTLKREEATQLYTDLRESHTVQYSDMMRPMGESLDRFHSPQKIKFKGPDEEFKFLTKYGGAKDTFEDSFISRSDPRGGSAIYSGAMLSIQRDTTHAAISTWMGAYPLLTTELMFSAIASRGVQTAVSQGLINARSYARNMLDAMMFPGRTSFSRAAETRKFAKAATNVLKLGKSGLRVWTSDLAASAAAYHSIQNFDRAKKPRGVFAASLKIFNDRFKAFTPAQRREIARRMMVVLSTDTRRYSGRFETGDFTGWGSWLESLTMRGFGITASTDMAKVGNAITMGGIWYNDAFQLPWKGLTDGTQNLLRSFGMTEDIWDRVRQLPGLKDNFRGVDMVMMDNLFQAIQKDGKARGLTDRQINDTFKAFHTFTYSLTQERGVPMQGAFEDAVMDVNRHDTGGVVYNFWQTMLQYKKVGVAAQRSLIKSAAEATPGKSAEFRMQGVARVMALMTFWGALQMQLRNILMEARTPYDMSHPQFWFEAMAQGGALGLAGDILLSDHTDTARGLLAYGFGPTISDTGTKSVLAVKGMFGALAGREEDIARFERLGRSLTPQVPFAGLILNTMFLKELGALGGDRAKFEKRRMKEQGYDYFAN